jgi:integrase
MFKENNARQGFIEQTAFKRMAAEAAKDGLWMRTFIEVAYSYGWRRGELLNLRVLQVDLINRTIRLDPGTTKNGEGREVVMTNEVTELLRASIEGKEPADYVFARDGGKPVKDFRGTWRNLCVRSGTGHWECGKCKAVLTGAKCECGGSRKYAGLIPHDFRRSAAKALRRAGVSESVIMAIGGWKTPSMFRRYAIVSNTDQRAAVEMLERAREVEKTSKPPVRPPNQETEHLGDEQERATIQ